MSIKAKFDSFNVTTDVATTTHAHTGYGGIPTLLIPFLIGRTEAANASGAADHKRAIGGGRSTADRHFVATQSQNGQAAAVTDQGARLDSLIGSISTAGAWSGYLDINSMDADGWTDVVDLQFATSFRAHLLAIMGAATEMVHVTEPAAAGVQTIGITGRAKAIYIVSVAGAVAPPTIVGDSRFMVGVAVDANGTIKNGILAGSSNDGSDPTVTVSYCRAGSGAAGDSFVGISNDHSGLNSRGRVTQMNVADQFQITWDEVIGDQARDHLCFVIYEGEHDIINVTTATNTTPFNVAHGNFRAEGGMSFSADLASPSTADVLDDKDEISIGAFAWNAAGTLEQGSMNNRDGDAAATTDVDTGIRFDGVHLNLTAAGAVDAVMAVTARGQGQLTFQMVDADPNARQAWVWVFGNAAADDRTTFRGIGRGILRGGV
jgi:hypothetical protein